MDIHFLINSKSTRSRTISLSEQDTKQYKLSHIAYIKLPKMICIYTQEIALNLFPGDDGWIDT